MVVKSVIDIEVNDESFKDFAATFEKYREALGETPGVWGQANKAAAGQALTVEALVAGLLTHEAINRKIACEEAEKSRQLDNQNRALTRQRVLVRDIAKATLGVLASIAKWTIGTGVVGGLLGTGSLLGLDRLALGVGSGRRSSQGLGATYGEEKSFENTYSRLVDPRSFLSGVSEAMTDVTKRAALYGAGMTGKNFEGKKTGEVANDLLPLLKKIVDKTPEAQLAQVLTARRLDQFISLEDARRLKATTPAEMEQFRSSYSRGVNELGLTDAVAKKWQDLGVQLDRAKGKIETVFVQGLAPLTKPLEHLSDAVANAVKSFLTGLDDNTIKDIGKGIEEFGKYLGSKNFRDDVKHFSEDVSYAARKMVAALKWLNLIPDRDAAGNDDPDAPTLGDKAASTAVGTGVGAVVGGTVGAFVGGPLGAVTGAKLGASAGAGYGLLRTRGGRLLGENAHWSARPNETNPGNIRMPGVKKGFAAFESSEAGIRALSKQIKLYEKRDHLDTIEKIVAKYAPASDKNDVKSYVDDVSKRTGIKADARVDTSDPAILAKIVSAITKHEGKKYYAPETVAGINKSGAVDPKIVSVIAKDGERKVPERAAPAKFSQAPSKPVRAPHATITINNNTGGSAVVQSSQVAKQG